MKIMLTTFITLSFLISTASAMTLEIKSISGFYDVWMRDFVGADEESKLIELYQSMKGDEVIAPTQHGTIGRKVLKNSAENFSFSCVFMDNFNFDKSKNIICDMKVAKFQNDNYEAYYYPYEKKEIDLIFHAQNSKEMITRFGLLKAGEQEDSRIDINMDDHFRIVGDKQTLNIELRE